MFICVGCNKILAIAHHKISIKYQSSHMYQYYISQEILLSLNTQKKHELNNKHGIACGKDGHDEGRHGMKA